MNTIAQRIYDYLKDFPPFQFLSKESCLEISKHITVMYLEENTTVFEINTPVKPCFYLVKEGAIGLFKNNTNLADKCDDGDIFGLRALVRQGNYELTARALEESILYKIPSEYYHSIISENAEANKFLIESFVSNTKKEDNISDTETSKILHFTDLQTGKFSKNPVTCSQNATIQEAAIIMTHKRVGSIVIVEENKPIGIITDKDLRTKIATGDYTIKNNVTAIMSSPVITYPENITVAEAQIAMIENKITHLCITKNGTVNSELCGILSEHDIIAVRGNNPSIIVKEIKRAKDDETLKHIKQKSQTLLENYLQQGIPITFISKIISSINTILTKRAIDLAILEMPSKPPVKFSWLALGSQGRKEQLLLTDQDNALVFEDVSDNEYKTVKPYFIAFAKKVNKTLNTIGFDYCPADMMASNTKWCLSVSEWKNQFNKWITHPDEDRIMLCTIFFDFNLVYGDKELITNLSESIFKSIKSYEIFLNFLALNALKNPPPLSFFRQFVLESTGEHKDEFDLKARAIMPLVDAARLLILSKGITDCNNTIERFEKLAALEPQNKDIYLDCSQAFKELLKLRTVDGIKDKDSGRFLDLKTLDKAYKLKLKNCFKSIKEVQVLISTRFKLSQIL